MNLDDNDSQTLTNRAGRRKLASDRLNLDDNESITGKFSSSDSVESMLRSVQGWISCQRVKPPNGLLALTGL